MKRNKKTTRPRLRLVAPDEDETMLPEPLPGFDVPREQFAALGLDAEPRLHAIYFAQNGAAVVYNGQSYRTVPVSEALDLSVWLADHGVYAMESGDWIVIDALIAFGYILPAEIARLTAESQWGREDSVLLEDLFDEG
jgi:hypothetical protein